MSIHVPGLWLTVLQPERELAGTIEALPDAWPARPGQMGRFSRPFWPSSKPPPVQATPALVLEAIRRCPMASTFWIAYAIGATEGDVAFVLRHQRPAGVHRVRSIIFWESYGPGDAGGSTVEELWIVAP